MTQINRVKKTIKQNILETLIRLNKPLAEHEIWQYFQPRGIYANGHCISARLNELERGTRRFPMVFQGKLYFIKTRKREGTNYNEWYIREALTWTSAHLKEKSENSQCPQSYQGVGDERCWNCKKINNCKYKVSVTRKSDKEETPGVEKSAVQSVGRLEPPGVSQEEKQLNLI